MKQSLYLTRVLLSIGICLLSGACADDNIPEVVQELPNEETSMHTIPMHLVGGVVGFDRSSDSTQSRASSTGWADGDKIYISFFNDNTIVPGVATYSTTTEWTVNYDGELAIGSSLKCAVRFFVGATSSSAWQVSLNANSEIYEDENATYFYDGNSLIVQGTLIPKTGRIRFTGTSGTTIYVTGISSYTSFSPASNTFSTTNEMIESQVAHSSTPYIYGSFQDTSRRISLLSSNSAFTRTFASDILQAGESGYMAIPTDTAHNNWRSGFYVQACGVEFKMIPVAGHSDGIFLIGETEVTEALYNSVNGSPNNSQLPMDNLDYSTMVTFIEEKLNTITGLNFALPTASQWEYAANGGNMSQNYIYSGSNTPDDVAWYADNATSAHDVKTKAPNELGIYDMSGNVGEMTSTMLSSYFSYPYIYGGSYLSSIAHITKNSYVNCYYFLHPGGGSKPSDAGYTNNPSGKSVGVGFRLMLKCP